jgi:hypothetical protein
MNKGITGNKDQTKLPNNGFFPLYFHKELGFSFNPLRVDSAMRLAVCHPDAKLYGKLKKKKSPGALAYLSEAE